MPDINDSFEKSNVKRKWLAKSFHNKNNLKCQWNKLMQSDVTFFLKIILTSAVSLFTLNGTQIILETIVTTFLTSIAKKILVCNCNNILKRLLQIPCHHFTFMSWILLITVYFSFCPWKSHCVLVFCLCRMFAYQISSSCSISWETMG